MKKVAWILALVFGLLFLGATLLNADLIGRSRKALSDGVLKDEASIAAARFSLVVVLPDTDDSFFRGILEGIDEAAPAAEAAVLVFRYPESSAEAAERYFEIAIRARADGLVMYVPRDGDIAERGARATASGVVFVPVGTDAPRSSASFFIGSGSLLQGLEGGKLICAELGASARVGVVLPAEGMGEPEGEPLFRGVAAALGAYPGARIVAVQRARSGLLSGEDAVATMLRAQPGINAIFCSSSRDTVGAAQVVVDSNKVGKILIIGADETPEIERYIDKGVVAASIVRDSKRIGEEAVRAFAQVKAGLPPPEALEAGFTVKRRGGGRP